MLKTKKYNKLIRDKISEKLSDKNIKFTTHIADENEYSKALMKKLEEEVKEFIDDNNEEELADIIEVINAIVDLKGFSQERIEIIRKDKAKKKGVFRDKIILDETTE